MKPHIQRAICILMLLYIVEYYVTFYVKEPRIDTAVSTAFVTRLLTNSTFKFLRMPDHTFQQLIAWLAAKTSAGIPRRGRHKPDVPLEERVAIFIAITGHAWAYHEVTETFGHSLETISR